MHVLKDKKRIYLDYNATTPPALFLQDKITQWLPLWGNPSSIHQNGQTTKSLIWSAKSTFARLVGCHPLELIALSGGSEANNMALKGLYEKYFPLHPERNQILISAVEHPSVKAPVEYLKSKGMKVYTIPVKRGGVLDMEAFTQALNEKTFLVACMYANNETGLIFPIDQMAREAKKVGSFFHCDGVQALGKLPLNLGKWEGDTMSFSAHKFYALKGVGLLYCRKGLLPASLIEGGPQERKRRAGTENVLGILSLGAVAEHGEEILKQHQSLKPLRDTMEKTLTRSLKGIEIIGEGNLRLANTSCMYIEGVDGQTLLMNMDLKGYSFSVGSACHSGNLNPSETLKSMGFSENQSRSVIRISLGLGVEAGELKNFVKDLTHAVNRIRSFSSKPLKEKP